MVFIVLFSATSTTPFTASTLSGAGAGLAADVIFLRAATKAAAAWRVALDFPIAGAFAAALLDEAAGALPVFAVAGAASATFFFVGISAFRLVGPAAFAPACRVEFVPATVRGLFAAPVITSGWACSGLVTGVAVTVLVVAGLTGALAVFSGGTRVAREAGFVVLPLTARAATRELVKADAAGFVAFGASGLAALVRLREAGWTAVRAAALDVAAGLALRVAGWMDFRPSAAFAEETSLAGFAAALVATEVFVTVLVATRFGACLAAFRSDWPTVFVFGGMMPLLRSARGG